MRKLKKNDRPLICLLCFAFLAAIMIFNTPVRAEEQRDLREGITGEYPKETAWGFIPRFKMNPDTGVGTGIKLKGANAFGTQLLLDIDNIYTINQYQQYEALAMLPRIGGASNYWYLMAYFQFDLIPDLRMFGVGNETTNEMFDEDDDKVGDETTVKYMNVAPRLTLGKQFGKNYYVAFQAFYREVWLFNGDNDHLPQALDVYGNLHGSDGGKTPGLALAFIRSTRNDMWRATGGTRFEVFAEDVAPYFGADYNYRRYGADTRAYFRLFGNYNVVAFHLRAETMEGEFNKMPWWELPYLGGRDSMRGYWEGRFRGRGALTSNTEFRYNIWNPTLKAKKKKTKFNIDGNVFFDAGRVYRYSADWAQENVQDLKYAGGFGFRFTSPPGLMGRMDVGFSREQSAAMYFNFGTVF